MGSISSPRWNIDLAFGDCPSSMWLGWALIDRDCSDLAVRGVRLEMSTLALFNVMNPNQKPIRAGSSRRLAFVIVNGRGMTRVSGVSARTTFVRCQVQ